MSERLQGPELAPAELAERLRELRVRSGELRGRL